MPFFLLIFFWWSLTHHLVWHPGLETALNLTCAKGLFYHTGYGNTHMLLHLHVGLVTGWQGELFLNSFSQKRKDCSLSYCQLFWTFDNQNWKCVRSTFSQTHKFTILPFLHFVKRSWKTLMKVHHLSEINWKVAKYCVQGK